MGRNRERKKIDERITFSWQDKNVMLVKSGGKCAHCGKLLRTQNVSAEHVIPLSKGGTNDIDNLVALCPDCNEKKDNFIYEPKLYYKYLKKDHLKLLQQNFEKYLTKVNWFSLTNMAPCDEVPVEYWLFLKGRYGQAKPVKSNIKFYKAQSNSYSSDRQCLLDYIEKYNTQKNIDCHGEDLEIALDTFLEKGAVYYAGSINDIKMIMPVRIENLYLNRLEREHYVLTFANPIYLAEGPSAADIAAEFVAAVVTNVASLAEKCGVTAFPFRIEYVISNTWYQYLSELIFKGMECGAYGFYDDYAYYKNHLEEYYDEPIQMNCFAGEYITASSSKFRYMRDIEGDATAVLENEQYTRFDRFIQKFCGVDDICDFVKRETNCG